MTSMPDLTSAALPTFASLPGAPTGVRATPQRASVAETLTDSAVSRADTRRVAAERHDVEIRSMTSDGVRAALTDSRRQVRPAMESLQRLYERPATGDRELMRREEEAKLAEADAVASRVRSAAARLVAVRISLQERAQRVGEEAMADAERLAEINRDLRSRGADDPGRAALVSEQRRLVDRVSEATGATATENADGTVDLRLDRPLVEGDRVQPLHLARSSDGAGGPDTAGSPVRPDPRAVSPDARAGEHDPRMTPPPPGSPARTPEPSDGTSNRSLVPGALQARWADGTPAFVGGRLGGYVGADSGSVEAAITGLDEVARALVSTTTAAQAGGTTRSGQAGPPLLEGDSALSLRVPNSVRAEDVAAGAPLPLVVDTAPPVADPTSGPTADATVAPSVPIPPAAMPSPSGLLTRVEGDAATTSTRLARRAEMIEGLDHALGLASSRVGRHLSEALGAVDGVSRTPLVAALHQANAAMAFTGTAARAAAADEIAVLVGSSDPEVVTATGRVGVDGEVPRGLVGLTVLSVAGEPVEAVPGDVAGASDETAGVGGDADPVDGELGLPGTPLGANVEAVEADDPALVGDGRTGAPLVTSPADTDSDTDADADADADSDASGGPVTVPQTPGGESTVGDTRAQADAEGASVAPGPAVPGPAPSPESVSPAAGSDRDGAAPVEGEELAEHTRVLLDGAEHTSSSTTVSSAVPGVDITVHGVGTATLAVTPDPGPALDRVQGLVDAVDQAVDAVNPANAASVLVTALPPDAGEATSRDRAADALASARSAMTSLWSSLSGAAGAPEATPTDQVAQVLGAVATPLVAGLGAAFVGPDGRPVIPGTHVDRGRVALDRERFAHEYVRDAVGVEGAIASVARSVAGTADAASDPRFGALAVRIQAELAPETEYSLAQAATDQRLDARQHELERRADSLQSLLEHLHDESTWLGQQLR